MQCLSFPSFCLTGEGRLLVAEVYSSRLFLHALELESNRVIDRTSLRIPVDLGPSASVDADSRDLWVFGENGKAARFDLASLELSSTYDLADLGPNEVFCGAELIPNSGYIWVTGDDGEHLRISVYDVERRRRVRRLDITEHWTCRGGAAPRIGVYGVAGPQLLDASGTPLPAPPGFWPAGLATHRDGERMVAIECDDADALTAVVYDARGPGPQMSIPQTHVDDDVIVAGSRDAGLVYVTREVNFVQRTELIALWPTGDQVAIAWRVEVPFRTALVSDPEGRRVAAVAEVAGGVQAIELDGRPPRFRPLAPAIPFPWPFTSTPVRLCGARDRGDRVRELAAARGWSDPELDAFVDEHRGDPGELLSLYHALQATGRADRVLELAAAEHPRDPKIAIAVADDLVAQKRWGEIAAALEGIDPLDPVERQHHLHILGLARLEAGDLERARETFAAAAALDGNCELGPHLALLGARGDSLVANLLAAIRGADDRLGAGDPSGALDALDQPGVWAAGELQHLARCAEALLQTDPADEHDKARRLAAFCDAQARPIRARQLPVPGAWCADRLAPIAARAQRWLEMWG